MAPVGGGEEYGNSLNSSHNSATGGLGGLPGGSGGGGSGAPGSAGGGGNRSNTLLFDTTKNELYRVTENLKTLQRKLKASQSMQTRPGLGSSHNQPITAHFRSIHHHATQS